MHKNSVKIDAQNCARELHKRTMSLPSSQFSSDCCDNHVIMDDNDIVSGAQRNLSFRQQTTNNHQIYNRMSASMDLKTTTIRQHYYPEGSWGYVVLVCAIYCHMITYGLQLSFGVILMHLMRQPFGGDKYIHGIIIGSLSTAITLFLSPLIIALCRRKSVRLIAILGGLVLALGCLFTSFATQFHQLYISYGIIFGVGVAMTRDTAVIMVGQYFKKRREFVEIFLIGSTGLGLAIMPLFISHCIRSKNWRFCFQWLAFITFLSFFLAILYRPASLYHPQRRAILHLKNLAKRSRMKEHLKAQITSTQKRNSTANANNNNNATTIGASIEKPPYFDFSVLKSRTIQILMCGTCISGFGITTPFLLMVRNGETSGIEYSTLITLHVFMGVGVMLGSCVFGAIIVKNSVQCMIARQYLCQTSCILMSAALLAFTVLDDYSGYLLFVCIYGFFYGGYQYSLKMFIYEKVRARNFNRAWGYVQCCQTVPIIVGVTITAFLNEHFGTRVGYYLSVVCIAFGSITLFFIDAHKKRMATKRKISSISATAVNVNASRRWSQDPNLSLPQYVATIRRSTGSLLDSNRLNGALSRVNNGNNTYSSFCSPNQHSLASKTNSGLRSNSIFSSTLGIPLNGDLTCISEECGLENYLDELLLDDCITSCNKEEKYLMLSEFENNLNNISDNEAANNIIIKRRKEELINNATTASVAVNNNNNNNNTCSSSKELVEFHEADCPMAKLRELNADTTTASKSLVATNFVLQNSSASSSSSSAAKHRRASYAGGVIVANTDANIEMYPLTVYEHCSSSGVSGSKRDTQCLKCGDKLESTHILVEEELEDSIDKNARNYVH